MRNETVRTDSACGSCCDKSCHSLKFKVWNEPSLRLSTAWAWPMNNSDSARRAVQMFTACQSRLSTSTCWLSTELISVTDWAKLPKIGLPVNAPDMVFFPILRVLDLVIVKAILPGDTVTRTRSSAARKETAACDYTADEDKPAGLLNPNCCEEVLKGPWWQGIASRFDPRDSLSRRHDLLQVLRGGERGRRQQLRNHVIPMLVSLQLRQHRILLASQGRLRPDRHLCAGIYGRRGRRRKTGRGLWRGAGRRSYLCPAGRRHADGPWRKTLVESASSPSRRERIRRARRHRRRDPCGGIYSWRRGRGRQLRPVF